MLYIPITLNHFFKPNFQSSQTERFNDQVEICKILNNQKYYNSYVKVLPKSFFKNIIFNYYNFEVNPIYNNISDYKNLIVNSNTVVTAMKKIKPKIVICDYFSTPAYELANSNSEIILMLDKVNYPKRDVLKILEKRFFIIHSFKEIYPIIKKIKFKKIKKNNNDFYSLFYKKKLDYKI